MRTGTALYNPFEPLTVELISELIREGHQYLLLQRFPWPGIAAEKSFMATAYKELNIASQHEAELTKKEGKTLDLVKDRKKIEELILSENFQLYYGTVKDENWKNKLIKAYKMPISAYVRTRTRIRVSQGVDIELKFVWGRLVAVLTSEALKYEVPAYELIK